MKATMRRIHGLMAEFDEPTALVAAAAAAHEQGYRRMDAYSPFPIEELHDAMGGHHSRLPLIVYLAGAAIAVGLSFAFVLVADVRADPPPAREGRVPPAWIRYPLRAIGLIGWIWVVAQGIAGGTSAGDVTTLFLWVYGWVLLAFLSAFVGPVWHWLDPFTTIHDIGAAALRRLRVAAWPIADYPASLGRCRRSPGSSSSSGSSSSGTEPARAPCSSSWSATRPSRWR